MAVIVIEDWMIEEEGLSGLELLSFALIHGCTQKGFGFWCGGYDELARRIGGKQRGTIMAIQNLLNKGLISKTEIQDKGVRKNAFQTVLRSAKNAECALQKMQSKDEGDHILLLNKTINKELKESVERIYKLYPSKCPIQNRSTGKCSKDKGRIARLLKTHSEEELTRIIQVTVENWTQSKTWFKNFSTFLNNLPDIEELDNNMEPDIFNQPDIPQPKFSNPGIYVGEDGNLHSRIPFTSIEEGEREMSKAKTEYKAFLDERNS